MLTEDSVRRVLLPFRDPATELSITSRVNGVTVTMSRGGKQERIAVDFETGRVTRKSPSQTFPSLASLVSSEFMADIAQFVQTQIRVLTPRMPVHGRLVGQSILRGDEVLQLNENLDALAPTFDGATQVTLLDGPAGVGKTMALERLALLRARAYAAGSARATPVLHVSSQGRRFSNLADVLAATTQAAGARFIGAQVATLARLGLICVAIDGFDELVDADGYQDAWHALRVFLDELEGAGSVILSGRDTFFDAQGFYDRLASVGCAITASVVHLNPATTREARAYLRASGWSEDEVDRLADNGVLEDESLFLRPYFLRELASTDRGPFLSRTAGEFLIDLFVDRETAIISRSTGLDPAKCLRAVNAVLEDVATDMAERERDWVDAEFLGLVCEIHFEGLLEPRDLGKLRHKMSSLAFLGGSGPNGRQRSFPHPSIRDSFLARATLREAARGLAMPTLRRVLIGLDFLEVYSDVASRAARADVLQAVQCFVRAAAEEGRASTFMSNVSSLALTAFAAIGGDRRAELADLEATEAYIGANAPLGTLTRVHVGRLDARGANLSSLAFSDCAITFCLCDRDTEFGESRPAIATIQVQEGGRAVVLRSPAKVAAWLARHAPAPSVAAQEPTDFERYFERVLRKAMRHFFIRQHAEDSASQLLEDPYWAHLEPILDRFGRIQRHRMPMGGPAAPLIRIPGAAGLLSPTPNDDVASAIRTAVREQGVWLAGRTGG